MKAVLSFFSCLGFKQTKSLIRRKLSFSFIPKSLVEYEAFYFDNRVITILIKKKPNIEMLNGESKRFKRDKNNKIAAFFDIAV